MSGADGEETDQPLRDGKAHDRALVLPLVGVLLLISPLAGIFQLDAKLAGVPFTLIYLFTVWAVLIVGAAALSRRLRGDDALPRNAGVADADTSDSDATGSRRE